MLGLNSQHKATIFTAFITAGIVLLAFNIHIKKKQIAEAETYYELEPEDPEQEKIESLEEVLESFDKLLATNKAVNTTKIPEELNEEQYEEMMERLQNRNNQDASQDIDQNENTSSKDMAEELESYESVQEIISMRSEKKRESGSASDLNPRNSTVSYSLVDRYDVYLPPPIYLCEEGGRIVISVKVNWRGEVTDANYNNASNSENGCLVQSALEYAKAAKFNSVEGKDPQLGTITFHFQSKG